VRVAKRIEFWYPSLIGAVLLLALIGYAAYAMYPRFDLPASTGGSLIVLAAAAGIASLFSPCSFPLLVTLLARESDGRSRKVLYQSTAAFTVGVILSLALIGLAIAFGAGFILARFTFTSPAGRLLRLMVGLLLIGFGARQLRGHTLAASWIATILLPLWEWQYRLRRRGEMIGYGLYGFGYVLAGIG